MAVCAPHTPKIARAAVKETARFIFSKHQGFLQNSELWIA